MSILAHFGETEISYAELYGKRATSTSAGLMETKVKVVQAPAIIQEQDWPIEERGGEHPTRKEDIVCYALDDRKFMGCNVLTPGEVD